MLQKPLLTLCPLVDSVMPSSGLPRPLYHGQTHWEADSRALALGAASARAAPKEGTQIISILASCLVAAHRCYRGLSSRQCRHVPPLEASAHRVMKSLHPIISYPVARAWPSRVYHVQ